MLRIKPPHGWLNPGGFDYEKWLFTRGVRATGYVRANDSNELMASPEVYTVQSLRQQLLTTLTAANASLQYKGILSALALGYRADIAPEDWQLLLNTGTNHLMAISGLHIGMVASLVYWLVLRCGGWFLAFIAVRWPIWPVQLSAAVAALSAGFGYALMAGFSIPTQRALIMLAVVLSSMIFLLSGTPWAQHRSCIVVSSNYRPVCCE